LGGGFRRSIHGKNCKVFNHILEILAIISQGKNQFSPIVMGAGRDFKGGLNKFQIKKLCFAQSF
ncbi:hypothetical protein, partial [uncultured Fibrobacter sp.]|uniref:hypothetical protein n=1 Tax=uncultured Fibrobacter sp. TaxID=261512 RepID=UPI002804BEF3